MFSADSATGIRVIDGVRQRVSSGETCYVVGLGVSGHDAGASLVQVSKAKGIRLLSNDEKSGSLARSTTRTTPRWRSPS